MEFPARYFKPTASLVEAARNPEKGGLYSDLPTPRWTCLKRLSGLHLPWFEIGVFLLLSGFAYLFIFYWRTKSVPFRSEAIIDYRQ